MNKTRAFAVQFSLLLAFWLFLSGQYRPLFLAMGVASAALVTALTHELFWAYRSPTPVDRPLRRLWRFVVYVVWLLGRIMLASLQVAYFVAHPRTPMDPGVLRFRTTLRSRLARVMLANSITLVPGTMTMTLNDDEYVVHALTPAAADDLLNARMQNMVGNIFLEQPDPPPEVVWEPPAKVRQ